MVIKSGPNEYNYITSTATFSEVKVPNGDVQDRAELVWDESNLRELNILSFFFYRFVKKDSKSTGHRTK